ncbi:hypothetical protein BD410DRAFT_433110 [Rickenella mellea]|uniref:Uncharacterized protein n=1 Tax=Rickenella mellea TaxID=50990 RepID=A0A4Y7PWS8_9AGAM|nr:hypothetical protein BD410DRAFT_433110 [Rickenella mellea]
MQCHYATNRYRRNQQAINLSHVCRRFRNVALQTAALWTHLDTHRPLSETKEFLSRSGSSPLTIECSAGARTELFPEFLAHIFPHSSRWSEVVELYMNIIDKDTREHGLAYYGPNLSLPNLASIRHTHIQDDPHEWKWEPWFYTPWSLPSLRSYTAVNVLPKAVFLWDGLTRCSLSWERTWPEYDCNDIDLRSIIHAREGIMALQHLSLSFDDIPFRSRPVDLPRATLLRVETVVFEVKGRFDVEQVVETLLSKLDLPKLNDLSSSWSVDAKQSTGEGLPVVHLFESGLIPPAKLRRLRVADDHSQLPYTLEDVMLQCTSLVDLTLCIPNAALFCEVLHRRPRADDTFMKKLPPQTWTLKDCDAISRDDLQYLIDELRRGPNWDTFSHVGSQLLRGSG